MNGSCSNVELDFGDLPDTGTGIGTGNYITAFQFDGPRHQLGATIYMGTAPDGETDAYATVAANGDTDDGVEVLPLSSTATQYSMRVTTTNTTGSDGNLYAWADWNKNGDLEASEMQTVTVPDGETDTVKVLTWPITSGITNGDTIYVRFRTVIQSLTVVRQLVKRPMVKLKAMPLRFLIMSILPMRQIPI
ncbi:GEVED domain-containing protein [Photobacterium damselae]